MRLRGKNRLPPYLTYATWRRLLEALQRHTPSRLDRTYFADLGFSPSTAVTIRGTLSFFGLIDPEDKPTEKLLSLAKVGGEGHKAWLKEVVLQAYQPVLKGLDLERATLGELQVCFRRYGAEGNVGQKCLAFFLALAKDAGIGLSPNLLSRSRVGAAPETKPSIMISQRRRVSSLPRKQSIQRADWNSLIESKFPNFDPNWGEEVRKEWYDRFQTLMILITKFPPFKEEWSEELKMKWLDRFHPWSSVSNS